MKTLHIKTSTTLGIVEQINTKLKGNLTGAHREHKLKLDNKEAFGAISCMDLKHGASYLEYDIVFHQDFKMVHESFHNCPIYFTYSMQDGLEHSFDVGGTKRQISKFQTGILRGRRGVDNVFYFYKEKPYKIVIIIVSAKCAQISAQSPSEIPHQIEQVFGSGQSEKNFAYLGSCNLKIAEKVKLLNTVSYDGVARRLFKEALVNTILALEIQQHYDDKKNLKTIKGSLNKKEMEMIKDLSEFIQNYPEREYTIKSLCARSGFSSAKLQEGFRIMHGKTVTHYIRHVRILTAEHMIKTTDLSISEIVYSIGLTSRSYFSKIFKKKYNCSPKHYQEQQGASSMVV